MREQQVFLVEDAEKMIPSYILDKIYTNSRVFIVCGKSYYKMGIKDEIERIKCSITYFSDFESNPTYASVVAGTEVYRKKKCNFIIAIGGGSAIDVAKCIKMFCGMRTEMDYLSQPPAINSIPLLAIPTTAGTGSESTSFAVIYRNKEKQSVSNEMLLPHFVILSPLLLRSLSEYQRKATLLDAFCHAVESFWSLRSTEESKKYSKLALTYFYASYEKYLINQQDGNEGMLISANYAGKAINIAQTTAAHAMSYKLTSLFQIAHGHAAALCLSVVWEFLLNASASGTECDNSTLKHTLQKLAESMGYENAFEAFEQYKKMLNALKLLRPRADSNGQLELLINSVNNERLNNFPILIPKKELRNMYKKIIEEGKQ